MCKEAIHLFWLWPQVSINSLWIIMVKCIVSLCWVRYSWMNLQVQLWNLLQPDSLQPPRGRPGSQRNMDCQKYVANLQLIWFDLSFDFIIVRSMWWTSTWFLLILLACRILQLHQLFQVHLLLLLRWGHVSQCTNQKEIGRRCLSFKCQITFVPEISKY